MQIIGMMSGTSLDGVDMALLESDGGNDARLLAHGFHPYSDQMRLFLRHVLDKAAALGDTAARDRSAWPDWLVEAEAMVTQQHIAALAGFDRQAARLIGFHGQTVLHRPETGLTLQIGDAAGLAKAVGLDVIGDFRQADMAAGGQGAPLAPLFHAALADGLAKPLAVLNLGGIANITCLADGQPAFAFDTGPANALLDDWVNSHTGQAYDIDGQLAASGQIDEAALAVLMAHPFFDQKPPKSLDRLAFSLAPVAALSVADGAATLTAFTAASVARALDFSPQRPARLLLCGGGRHNPVLRDRLANFCNMPVEPCEAVGWHGDSLEAQAFAWLALRSLQGLPLSLPSTTGASAPVSGGRLYRAADN
ncbi:MAG: anhydro-N-acetylmuramic acid kinase [Parvibaculales bacterium]